MSEKQESSNAPIESYAVIGDCETAALVCLDGSMDWLCWPDFSSDACFARLLGNEENGRWLIAPATPAEKTTRRYRDDTLILETTFECADYAVMLIDFMPIRGASPNLVRIVQGLRGAAPMKMQMSLRFNYGAAVPWVTRTPDGIQAIVGPHLVVLRTPIPLTGEDLTTISEFTVNQGESVEFVMSYGPSHLPLPAVIDVPEALKSTQDFWATWSRTCTYEGPYRDAVVRSLITLKALTYRPTGGIVAAVTTSLPELLGSSRNWDYRYCWLRDATFTLLAFMHGGYYEEAEAWQQWLLRAVAGGPDQVQIMYGIAGQRYLPERELSWLAGYENSKPVRIGNAASEQLQLDIYGEVLSAFWQGLQHSAKDGAQSFAMLRRLVEHLEAIWQEPDEGIWETRGGRKHFTYSKLMAWVAFDRAIKAAGLLHANAPVERWQKVRAAIHEEVCAQGYNQKLGSFVQSYGSNQLDASLLLMPFTGFLPPDDSRVKGTLQAIEKTLMSGGLVARYNTVDAPDGLPPGEGVFLACSFWMVGGLRLQGRQKDAEKLFEHVVTLANDVGLLAEEYDTGARRLVGNFPQALSHISLVNAAFGLADGRGETASIK